MTWDQLLETICKAMAESGAYLRTLESLMVKVSENGGSPDHQQTNLAFKLLLLAVSNLHSAIESISIGLDAIVEIMREAGKSQEAGGE